MNGGAIDQCGWGRGLRVPAGQECSDFRFGAVLRVIRASGVGRVDVWLSRDVGRRFPRAPPNVCLHILMEYGDNGYIGDVDFVWMPAGFVADLQGVGSLVSRFYLLVGDYHSLVTANPSLAGCYYSLVVQDHSLVAAVICGLVLSGGMLMVGGVTSITGYLPGNMVGALAASVRCQGRVLSPWGVGDGMVSGILRCASRAAPAGRRSAAGGPGVSSFLSGTSGTGLRLVRLGGLVWYGCAG